MPFKNKKQFIARVSQDASNRVIKDIKAQEIFAEFFVKKAVVDLDVVDTRNLLDNTTAKSFIGSNSVTMTFRTDASAVPYWVYPYYGLSTSVNYGQRKWAELGARYWLASLGIKASSLKSSGGGEYLKKEYLKTGK